MKLGIILLISFFTMVSLYAQYGTGVEDNKGLNETAGESKIVIVQEGDTLWDLCEKHLGDPFLWPKIWALNPEVENPHVIEPGDKIKFNLRTGEIRITPENKMGTTNISSNNFDNGSFGSDNGSLSVSDKKVFSFSKKSRNGDINNITVRNEALLSEKKFKRSGKITSSKEGKVLLSKSDEVYLKFKNLDKIKLGDKYHVYKIRKKLSHPIRDKEYGYLIDIMGELTIVGKTKSKAIAVITTAYKEIERGNYVVPKINLSLSVDKVATPRRIDGHIIDFVKTSDYIANKELVFIDKGSNDGVKKGMIFRVIKDKDPVTGDYIPTYGVGKIIIMSSNKKTSTGFMIIATQEIAKGDRITTEKAREKKEIR